MERRFSLQGAGRQSNDAALKTAINDVMAEDLTVVGERLTQVEGHVQRVADAKLAHPGLVSDGPQIVGPPAGCVAQAPLSTNVIRQADTGGAAIDRGVEDASEFGLNSARRLRGSCGFANQSHDIGHRNLGGRLECSVLLTAAYSFGRAIRNAMAISERVAAGNLSEKISTRRRDELGRLLVSLGRMQDALRNQAEAQRLAAELKDQDH